MGPVAILLRVAVGYLFLVLLARLSGKRTIRQVMPVDLATAIIASDLIDNFLWGEVSAATFAVAFGTLAVAAILVTLAAARSPRVHRWIFGTATVIVREGVPVPEAMRRERLSEMKLAALFREQGLDDLREVACGTLEPNGRVGILRREWAEEAQKQDAAAVRAAAGGKAE